MISPSLILLGLDLSVAFSYDTDRMLNATLQFPCVNGIRHFYEEYCT